MSKRQDPSAQRGPRTSGPPSNSPVDALTCRVADRAWTAARAKGSKAQTLGVLFFTGPGCCPWSDPLSGAVLFAGLSVGFRTYGRLSGLEASVTPGVEALRHAHWASVGMRGRRRRPMLPPGAVRGRQHSQLGSRGTNQRSHEHGLRPAMRYCAAPRRLGGRATWCGFCCGSGLISYVGEGTSSWTPEGWRMDEMKGARERLNNAPGGNGPLFMPPPANLTSAMRSSSKRRFTRTSFCMWLGT